MEKKLADLPIKESKITISTKPYEIKTVKVGFAPLSAPKDARPLEEPALPVSLSARAED